MNVRLQTSGGPSAGSALSADLVKLRRRFGQVFPAWRARAEKLSWVPVGLRYLLCLYLELSRVETLPPRYRRLVDAHAASRLTSDADLVERLVGAYGGFLHAGEVDRSAALLPELARFFTEPQIVEMTLLGSLAHGLALFDAVLAQRAEG